MYVGSKDHVLSLDLHDINREPLIVRARPDVGQGDVGGRGPPGWGAPAGRPSDPLLWQIHWAATPQRIEECVLSGKDGNVSAVGSTGGLGWGGQGARGPQEGMGPGRHLGHLLGFPSGPRVSAGTSSGSSSPGTEHTCTCVAPEPTTPCAPM